MIYRLHSDKEKNQAPITLAQARRLNVEDKLALYQIPGAGEERAMVFMDEEDFKKILKPKKYSK